MIKRVIFSLFFLLNFSFLCFAQENNYYYTHVWQEAHGGDSEYQYLLGLLFRPNSYAQSDNCDIDAFYADGSCHTKSNEAYFYWIQKASDNNYPRALNDVGYCYEMGIAVEVNEQLAFEYYNQAADLQNPIALYNLGNIFYQGGFAGFDKDYELAEYFYLKSAENGYDDALLQLASFYIDGLNQEQKGIALFEKMYKTQPHSDNALWASYKLGAYYQTKKNYPLAMEWYKKSSILLPLDKLLTVDNYQSYPLPYLPATIAWNQLNGDGIKQNIPKAIELFYHSFQTFLRLNDEAQIEEFITQSIYYSPLEEQWTKMFLAVLQHQNSLDSDIDKALIATLFPDNPDAIEQFKQQITELESVNTTLYYKEDAACGDFLHHLDSNAPDYFVYQACDISDTEQGKPIRVTYKVDGDYGVQSEQYLMEKFNMNPLSFICCHWETDNYPASQFFNPKENLWYSIYYTSEETLYSDRNDWDKIQFYLTIELDREDI